MFEKLHLDRLITLGNNYLVSQTYSRADHFTNEGKISILLSDYKNLGEAALHLNAVKNDRFAAIINLKKETHLQKIRQMMEGSEYTIYWAVVKSTNELKKRLDASYKSKIRRYLVTQSSWRIGSDEEVDAQFEVTFGELFLVLKWRTKNLRIKFEEIERRFDERLK